MSSYKKTVASKLSFKGSSSQPKKKRKKEQTNEASVGSEVAHATSSIPEQEDEITILNGSGRITTSGTTVHGHGTSFMSELRPGDAVIVFHPTSLREETKIVRMVLSDISMGISSPFSSDLVSTATFKYIKAPRDLEAEAAAAAKKPIERHKTEEAAYGTYASQGGEKIVYRVKKASAFGGYKIVTESANGGLTREQLLDMRSKKKSDRICG